MNRSQKPQPVRFKCNISASFSSIQNHTAIEICLQDDDGAYVLAKTMSISPMSSADVSEALGQFHAIQWLFDMCFNNVDFVVDSKTAVDAFNSNRTDVTKFGHISASCGGLYSSHLTNSSVEFNRRQANVVDYVLASETTLSARPNIYLDVSNCIAFLL